MNIPAITGIDNALKIYYNNLELGNKEIIGLFGNRSSATITRLKNTVKSEMIKRNVMSYGTYKVNTNIAYEVWGIDINDLKKRKKELAQLGYSTDIQH